MRALLFALFALTLTPAAQAASPWQMKASGGTTNDLSKKRKRYTSRVTQGQLPKNVRGVATCGTKGHTTLHWALYKNGTLSVGPSDNLGAHRPSVRVTFAGNKSANDVVGLACRGERGGSVVSPKNHVNLFVYFQDGTYAKERVRHSGINLFHFSGYKSYQLPGGYTPNQIRGVAMDDATGLTCAWFMNKKVSCGNHHDLDRKRKPYRYTAPEGPGHIVGVGIDGKNKRVTAWYR